MKRNFGIIGAVGISVLGLAACGGVADEINGETGSHSSALERRDSTDPTDPTGTAGSSGSTATDCPAGAACDTPPTGDIPPTGEEARPTPGVEPDELIWDEQDPSLGGGRDIGSDPLPGVEPDEIDAAQAFQGDVPLLAILFQNFGSPGLQHVGSQLLQAYQPPQGGGGLGGFSQGNGKLKEVEVAHIGGTGSINTPIVVTVAGTGSVGVLSSFRSSNVGATPVHLQNSPKLLGHNHQLRVLRPEGENKLSYRILLSARITNDNLWLTTWRVGANGVFQHLDTLGYGRSVGVDVDDYALTHRTLAGGTFQVVTPIAHGNQMRLITWHINGTTGKIAGKFQSGDAPGSLQSGGDLTASLNAGDALTAPHFVVAYKGGNSALRQTLWNVSNAGLPSLLNSSTSGRDIQNVNSVNVSMENVALAPINDTGHVSAYTLAGNVRMTAWEDSICTDDTCQFVPLRVGSENLDLQPNNPGVQQGGNAFPTPNTLRVMVRDPIANVDRFTRNPDTVQAIASVRKVMVTIVALDAVRAGEVDLDDIVTVSAAAANVNGTGASAMGLQAGEKISLRNLLYGNMMVSAGDATWAISEYVAGSVANMVTRMNNKANTLGLSNTFHCQRGSTFSSVSYSTARDQAALWESVFDDELFVEFAGEDSRLVCGTVNNSQVCHPVPQAQPMLNGAMTNYPNMDGYKTGGGGGKCQDIQQYATTPTCPSGGCLAVQTTRIGRPLVVTELQPENLNGTRWGDAANLQDWTFRQIFTPDFRGDSGAQAGTTTDFGIDGISDLHAVAATLNGNASFKVCNWATDPQGGDVAPTTCTTYALPGLAASARELSPTRLQMVTLSTLYADADYLLGHLDGSDLQMQLWRVGQRE
jgi:D-alanyl-D-alanine carboxypeptidase